MKKVIPVFIIIIIGLNIIKKEMIFYTPINIPGSLMAMTIPPFGIFIEKKYRNEGNGPKSIIRHEKVHWTQYKKMGLLQFYYRYFAELIKYGRFDGPMEVEARRLSK